MVRTTRALVGLALALSASACSGPLSMLESASSESSTLAGLFWALTALTLVPALLYIAFAVAAALRSRVGAHAERELPEPLPESAGLRPILAFGAGLPTFLAAAALVVTLGTGAALEPGSEEPALTIDVVGHQFWWEVVYPEHGVVTANEIHVPAGRPLRFRLASADVIHSFWIPRVVPKRDMTPGHVTEVRTRGTEPGVYRGQCYEFCGVQHALMGFELVALPEDEFDAWLERARRASPEPTTPIARRGLEVYAEAECAHCHAIRGLVPPGETRSPGPDLTHLASRRTLGSALLPNDAGHLAGWILDPQQHKPGVRMPPSWLAAEDLHALLAFLGGLE